MTEKAYNGYEIMVKEDILNEIYDELDVIRSKSMKKLYRAHEELLEKIVRFTFIHRRRIKYHTKGV